MTGRCGGSDARLAAWVDGELSADEEKELASHILLCDECACEVGRMAAHKCLLRRPEPQRLRPPRGLWARLVAELDRVDGVERALGIPTRRRRSLVPVLVACGVILIAAALWARTALLPPPAPIGEQLVAIHDQALQASGLYLGPLEALQAVGNSMAPPRPQVRWQAVGKINGQFMIHRICTAGPLPLSLITAPQAAVPLDALERVVRGGEAYHVASAPTGVAVVAVRQGMSYIFVAHTTLDDLLTLAQRMLRERALLVP